MQENVLTSRSKNLWSSALSRKKKGSSLAEMLITVLLMGIVLTAVSSGTGAVIQAYRKIVMKAEAMTLMSTITNTINGELKNIANLDRAGFIDTNGDPIDYLAITDTVVLTDFQSGLRNYRIEIRNGCLNDDDKKAYLKYEDELSTGDFPAIVCSTKRNGTADPIPLQLVPSAAYTNKLKAYLVNSDGNGLGKIEYNKSAGTFHYKIRIVDRTKAGLNDYLVEQSCDVRPLNQ